MTRPFSLAFEHKMVDRPTGKDASNPSQLAREIVLRRQNLRRWIQVARSLPRVGADDRIERKWAVEQKPRVVAEGCELIGPQLTAYLTRKRYSSFTSSVGVSRRRRAPDKAPRHDPAFNKVSHLYAIARHHNERLCRSIAFRFGSHSWRVYLRRSFRGIGVNKHSLYVPGLASLY